MKRILLLITLFTIIISLNVSKVKASETHFYINNNNIEISEEQYINLINLGFTEQEISNMSKSTFESNKDIVGELVYQQTKYYKSINDGLNNYTYEIDETEYLNHNNIELRGTIQTHYLSITTSITRLSDTFRYKVSTNWLDFPSVKNFDVIAIGMNNQVYISSDVYFELIYCDTSSCYESTACSPKKTSNGGGASFKLPNVTYTSLSSILYFEVSKNTSNTITNLSMCGAYAHAGTTSATLTDATNYTLSSSGISFNAGSVGKFDIVQCSSASWSGSW